MPRETISEIILAAVRLVSDDDDVSALREEGISVAFLIREKFLDGSENDATGLAPQ